LAFINKKLLLLGISSADPVPRLYPWTSVPRTSNPIPFAYSKYATRCGVKKYRLRVVGSPDRMRRSVVTPKTGLCSTSLEIKWRAVSRVQYGYVKKLF